MRLHLSLSPGGRLSLVESDDAPDLERALAQRLRDAFARGPGEGLLQLGGAEVGTVLPAALAYWREVGARYVTALCAQPGGETRHVPIPPPGPADLDTLVLGAPAMPGAEYLTAGVLTALWAALDAAVAARRAATRVSTEALLQQLNPAWRAVGRVYFNLAENRRDDAAPFAFLATWTHQLSARGTAQHLPLGEALREYAGARNRERLLSLLLPVQRAAEVCPWLRAMVDAGEIYHPLRWSPQEAYQLLADLPVLERAGVIVRMPAAWRTRRPARPRLTATVGTKPATGLGTEALLDFRMAVTLDGAELTAAELRRVLAGTRRLELVRGQWVEVDAEQLRQAMDRFREAERVAAERGLSFAEASRLVTGGDVTRNGAAGSLDSTWAAVEAGPWLAATLRQLRAPDALAPVEPGGDLRGTLRPYQSVGVRWLSLLSRLGLGACLADDMGLGKTIQVLSLLLVERRAKARGRTPSLLVAPASLLANWEAEIARFAPALRTVVAHSSAMPAADLAAYPAQRLAGVDLVLTTYATLVRVPWLTERAWHLAIFDEAQALRNPGTAQARAARQLKSTSRIALTGTPIENRLGDLWSIFDVINPGLLGSAQQFNAWTRRLAAREHNPYGALRELVRPYILRRLKTDRSVVSDLPEKTEVKAWCLLSRRQAALYQDAVAQLAARLAEVGGIERRGIVLAFLTRFKQICNHPSHWLKDDAWQPEDSGKLLRLRELAEVIASRQEKALVFTQYREVTAPLAAFLGGVFGRPGLTLHGQTAVKQRGDLVRRFQEEETIPFLVASLKAGGSGLNLTAASHVIHFDRWWNPAVEAQATDRAFRIGQTKNVLVHTFICRGTVEEKIDALIASKARLSADVLEGGAEVALTELRDDELLRLVSLDLAAATAGE